jgi:hypothetical protein
MAGDHGRRNRETTDGARCLPRYGDVRAGVLARVASVQRVDDECARVQRARVGSPDRAQSRKGPVLNRPESAAPFLNCPRCGLSIRPKTRWMTIEYCPRCLARARVAVKMFSSALPAAELYREGQAPQADARGAPTTSRSGSR